MSMRGEQNRFSKDVRHPCLSFTCGDWLLCKTLDTIQSTTDFLVTVNVFHAFKLWQFPLTEELNVLQSHFKDEYYKFQDYLKTMLI